MSNLEIKSHRGNYRVVFDNSDIKIENSSFVLIDSNVNKLYPSLTFGIDPDKIIIIEASEENKSLEFCKNLISLLLDKGIKKNHKLIAIGGGITQDVTGFVASILYRGIGWLFYPTTLLAQADSCIGSKTSINFLNVKNLVGTFYPPREIICNTEFLNTLDKSEIKSGIGEILHYYIYDGNPKTFEIEKDYDRLLIDRNLLMTHIQESLKIKKEMIQKDEFDTDQRQIFNYGHTFGHAIEVLSEYKIPHGQAVTLGMDLANYISYSMGFLSFDKFSLLSNVLSKNKPIFNVTEKIDEYMSLLSKDKKNIDNTIVCILASDFGQLFIHQVTDKQNLRSIILDFFGRSE
tara:strand:+ start:607 stop:1647 length:1041 start_codon:yes stop_codon:yes gene_type:complete